MKQAKSVPGQVRAYFTQGHSFIEGVTTKAILEAVNLSSVHTFAKHYCLGVVMGTGERGAS